MAATADKFDALSNNELRDQLKSLGLGNFPVTDTTRNALIKKLRNAVNGPAKPVKNRRETLSAVVKQPSADELESDTDAKKSKAKTVSNRRATIAAGAAPKTNFTNGTTVQEVAAPTRQKSPSRKSVAPINFLNDASDDDLVAAAEEAEKTSKPRKSRTSRSPSLSKSSVVTTSYKHTIEPLYEQNDDVIVLNDNSDSEFASEMLEKLRKPSTPTTKISVNDRRKTLQSGPTVSTNYSGYTSQPAEEPSSAYRRRYTTYTSPTPASQNVIDSTDDVLKGVETPFLSDFTRRLAELKAANLPGTDTTVDYRTPKSSTSTYLNEYRSSVYSSRVGDRFRDKPISSLQQKPVNSKWSNLEKKMRWPLAIIFALFVAVSVYVFLFADAP